MQKAVSLLVVAAAIALPARAQDFDACEVLTQQDVEAALGTTAAPEPVNPKVKRPKVVPTCTYTASKEGKPVSASANFRFGKTDGDVQKAFDDHRLEVQTKPMLFRGAEGFWSAKTGQMNVRKGRTWVQVTVGGATPKERDAEASRKLAEKLLAKIS